MRTLLPAVPINHRKCLLTLGNALSFGAQRYSKTLYLQVFPMQHMAGGVLGMKLCILLHRLTAGLGRAVSSVAKGPAAENGSAGPWEQGEN